MIPNIDPEIIEQVRRRRRLSQSKAADEIGISRSTFARIVSGNTRLQDNTAELIGAWIRKNI